MKAGSIALTFTSFLTTLLAVVSLIILFVPFPTRTLNLDSQDDSPSNTYSVFGYTFTRRDESPTATFNQIATELTTPLATDVHLNYRPTSTISKAPVGSQPTQLPRNLEERAFTGFSGDHFTFSHGSGSSSPFNSGSSFGSNSVTVAQARPAGVAAILLLVSYILLIIEPLALGIYFIVKSKKVGASTNGRVVVAGAIFHFAFLILLAILLLIPLAFLLQAVDLFNRAGNYLSSTFIGRTLGNSQSFAHLAGPVVATLVLGWLLLVSVIALAVLVFLHRERNNSVDMETIRSKEEMQERNM